jgi:hypothetical protein
MAGKNPFEEALKNFKPAKKFDGPEKVAKKEPTESEGAVSSEGAEPGEQFLQSNEDKGEQEKQEDEALFSELANILGLRESDRSYSRIRKLIADSRKVNVAFDVDRFLSFEAKRTSNPRAKEIIDFILKRGFSSDALGWLRSATPQGMQYGTAKREVRIENARKLAEAADISLEEIARKNHISL